MYAARDTPRFCGQGLHGRHLVARRCGAAGCGSNWLIVGNRSQKLINRDRTRLRDGTPAKSEPWHTSRFTTRASHGAKPFQVLGLRLGGFSGQPVQSAGY